MKLFKVAVVASVFAFVGACGSGLTDSSTTLIVGLRVEVAPGSKVLVFDSVGTRTNLQVHAIDARGVVSAPPSAVAFTSRNPAVAAVDANGQVTTLSKGSTWVVGGLTVSEQEFKDSVQVVYGITGF